MSDRIRDSLAARIINGDFPAGDRLIELAIAREFDTSQTPVREALRELEALRLVESIPFRGTRVREITPREMAEAYSVRVALEQMAAELAGPRFLKSVHSLESRRLETAVEALSSSAHAGDVEGFAKANLTFHRTIVEAAGNQVLLQTWESLGFETRMRVNLARQPVNLEERIAEHAEIARALAAGDGVRAGKLLREHAEFFIRAWKESTTREVVHV